MSRIITNCGNNLTDAPDQFALLSESLIVKYGFIKDYEQSNIIYGAYEHINFDIRVDVFNGKWEYCINKGSKNIEIKSLSELQKIVREKNNQELTLIN